MEFENRCRELLESRRTEAFGVDFHQVYDDVPAHISSVAGAHHALAIFQLDRERALAELRAVYASCQRESGMLALERACSDEASEARVAHFGPLYLDEGPARLIGPPVAAYVAARICLEVGADARDLLDCATRQLDAIWGERLPPDTSLPVILHPLESGSAGSPLFDSMIDAEDLQEWQEESTNVLRSAIACQLDPERALRAGHPFVVEDPVFCGWTLLALEEASLAWRALGDDAAEQKLRIRSEMIAEGIRNRLWWDGEEIFAGFDRQRDLPLQALTAGGLVPAGSRLLIEEGSARRALGRHLQPGGTPLWGKHGISFNPIVSEGDAALPSEIPWRGNTISPSTHDAAHLALMRVERHTDARAAREQLEDLALAQGFREFYDALSGAPLKNGSSGQYTGATLGLEMRAREAEV